VFLIDLAARSQDDAQGQQGEGTQRHEGTLLDMRVQATMAYRQLRREKALWVPQLYCFPAAICMPSVA
ncbi:MAG: hypothetical protein ACRESP_08205, partial [Pseudomonas sp.]